MSLFKYGLVIFITALILSLVVEQVIYYTVNYPYPYHIEWVEEEGVDTYDGADSYILYLNQEPAQPSEDILQDIADDIAELGISVNSATMNSAPTITLHKRCHPGDGSIYYLDGFVTFLEEHVILNVSYDRSRPYHFERVENENMTVMIEERYPVDRDVLDTYIDDIVGVLEGYYTISEVRRDDSPRTDPGWKRSMPVRVPGDPYWDCDC